MSGIETLSSPEDAARRLTTELQTAFHALTAAAATYGEVQGRAAEFLEANNAIPRPDEGLDEDMNELYKLWTGSPDADEVFSIIER